MNNKHKLVKIVEKKTEFKSKICKALCNDILIEYLNTVAKGLLKTRVEIGMLKKDPYIKNVTHI